jgi:hypothetical protein
MPTPSTMRARWNPGENGGSRPAQSHSLRGAERLPGAHAQEEKTTAKRTAAGDKKTNGCLGEPHLAASAVGFPRCSIHSPRNIPDIALRSQMRSSADTLIGVLRHSYKSVKTDMSGRFGELSGHVHPAGATGRGLGAIAWTSIICPCPSVGRRTTIWSHWTIRTRSDNPCCPKVSPVFWIQRTIASLVNDSSVEYQGRSNARQMKTAIWSRVTRPVGP